MPGLRVTQFRVLNYRNIDDSGWIPIERVTALVGRNESGKTTLLKALHKFNPAIPEPYQPQREFPRDRFAREFKDAKDWPVCQVEFEIDDALRARFLQAGQYDQLPTHFSVTRYYDGHLTVEFSPEVIEAAIPPEPLLHALGQFTAGLANIQAPSAEEHDLAAARTRLMDWAAQIASEAAALASLKSREGIALLARGAEEASRQSTPPAGRLHEQLAAAARALLDRAYQPPTLPRLWELAMARMPVFIYFEQYGILNSAVYLPHLVDQLQREPTNPRVRTANAIFKHVGLTAHDILELGRDGVEERRRSGEPVTDRVIEEEMAKRELRQVKLNAASLDITTKFAARWHQRRHQIRYHADGSYFRIWIADDRRPGVEIELESRSKGFQWFFSFNLVFLVESAEGHKDAVLLLDEPGLDLHPTAQQELVAFFEELARSHQLLYTTHSPFLIDGQHLERIRPVREDASGHSEVSAVGMWPDDRETMYPLHAAAGYAMVKNLFDGKKNLLVEDLADCLYIQGLALVLGATRRQTLPNDVCVTPCGGATNLGYLASLLRGHSVRPVILLDSDDATRTRQEPLLKELHVGEQTSFILLGEVLGLAECGIEDIVGENLILPAVSRVTGKQISITSADRGPTLSKRIEQAAAREGVALPEGWKAEVARQLVGGWADQSPGTLPVDLLNRAEALMKAIAGRFEDPITKKP